MCLTLSDQPSVRKLRTEVRLELSALDAAPNMDWIAQLVEQYTGNTGVPKLTTMKITSVGHQFQSIS